MEASTRRLHKETVKVMESELIMPNNKRKSWILEPELSSVQSTTLTTFRRELICTISTLLLKSNTVPSSSGLVPFYENLLCAQFFILDRGRCGGLDLLCTETKLAFQSSSATSKWAKLVYQSSRFVQSRDLIYVRFLCSALERRWWVGKVFLWTTKWTRIIQWGYPISHWKATQVIKPILAGRSVVRSYSDTI